MLIVFGSYEKHTEVKRFDFSAGLCPVCKIEMKVMETSRYFSLMYFINFKTETLGYYYLCPQCKTKYSSHDINKLTPEII